MKKLGNLSSFSPTQFIPEMKHFYVFTRKCGPPPRDLREHVCPIWVLQ